jgi:hypothetical protein
MIALAHGVVKMYNTISLLVAASSLIVSLIATGVAKQSRDQATRVADRDSIAWKQRKWFDLYFEAEKAYDMLDQFQTQYHHGAPPQHDGIWNKYASDVNALMSMIRRVHSMAAVFPMNPAVDKLFESAVFPNEDELLSIDRKTMMFDAVQDIREKALIKNLDILE